jgi:hypothetical protein
MDIRLSGYFPLEQRQDFLALKIPVFTDGELFLIQKINELSDTVSDLIDVGNIETQPIDAEVSLSRNDPAFYILQYNDKVFKGTRREIYKTIFEHIEGYNLSYANLYSLYCFLGLPRLVVKTVDAIIETNELGTLMPLKRRNFLIPIPQRVLHADELLLKSILIQYSNIFLSSRQTLLSDITPIDQPGEDDLVIGIHCIERSLFTDVSHSIVRNINTADIEDAILNDFILSILIVYKLPFPEDSRVQGRFIPDEVLTNSELMRNDVSSAISDLQARSSTTYHTWEHARRIGNVNFVMLSQYVERDIADQAMQEPGNFTDLDDKEINDIKTNIINQNKVNS